MKRKKEAEQLAELRKQDKIQFDQDVQKYQQNYQEINYENADLQVRFSSLDALNPQKTIQDQSQKMAQLEKTANEKELQIRKMESRLVLTENELGFEKERTMVLKDENTVNLRRIETLLSQVAHYEQRQEELNDRRMREKDTANSSLLDIKSQLSDAIGQLNIKSAVVQEYRDKNQDLLKEKTQLRIKIDQQDHQISLLQDKMMKKLEDQTYPSKKDNVEELLDTRIHGEISRVKEVYQDLKKTEVEAEKLRFVLGQKEKDIFELTSKIEVLQHDLREASKLAENQKLEITKLQQQKSTFYSDLNEIRKMHESQVIKLTEKLTEANEEIFQLRLDQQNVLKEKRQAVNSFLVSERQRAEKDRELQDALNSKLLGLTFDQKGKLFSGSVKEEVAPQKFQGVNSGDNQQTLKTNTAEFEINEDAFNRLLNSISGLKV